MSLGWVVPVVTVLALLVGIANTVWLWWSKSNDADQKKIEKIEGQVSDHDRRIGRVEGEMAHLPSKEAVHDLTIKLTELAGKFAAVDGEVNGISRTVDRIERYLLDGSKVA